MLVHLGIIYVTFEGNSGHVHNLNTLVAGSKILLQEKRLLNECCYVE